MSKLINNCSGIAQRINIKYGSNHASFKNYGLKEFFLNLKMKFKKPHIKHVKHYERKEWACIIFILSTYLYSRAFFYFCVSMLHVVSDGENNVLWYLLTNDLLFMSRWSATECPCEGHWADSSPRGWWEAGMFYKQVYTCIHRTSLTS